MSINELGAMTVFLSLKYLQRQIQDYPKGGWVWVVPGMDISYFGIFVAGHIMRYVDKTLADKMTFKIARENKMLAIL